MLQHLHGKPRGHVSSLLHTRANAKRLSQQEKPRPFTALPFPLPAPVLQDDADEGVDVAEAMTCPASMVTMRESEKLLVNLKLVPEVPCPALLAHAVLHIVCLAGNERKDRDRTETNRTNDRDGSLAGLSPRMP